jgi:thiamine transport system substrate-binding protein
MVNQAIITVDNPVADVLFGVDDSFLSRALDAGIFAPYESPLLVDVPDDLRLDPQNRVTPIDRGDVCLNYDIDFFSGDLTPPLNLEQLTNPEYAGLLVVQHPGSSSPGMAFLLSTIATFGEDGWQDYWRDLVANDVRVVRTGTRPITPSPPGGVATIRWSFRTPHHHPPKCCSPIHQSTRRSRE